MAWTTPQNSRNEVNRQGKILLEPTSSIEEKTLALIVINNWRTSHSFPLNTVQNGLRNRAQSIDPNALVSQRIKRLKSIEAKLKFRPGLKLVQIQDIAGCRAVLANINMVDELVRLYENESNNSKHVLFHKDDYIQEPKHSGYRSVHLVYKYKSNSINSQPYDNLKVEIQIRTVLQHAWATAVETVDSFTNQSLKSGNGNVKWAKFFALVSCGFAHIENKPMVNELSNDIRLIVDEIRSLEKELRVTTLLNVFAATLSIPNQQLPKNGHYFVLELDPDLQKLDIHVFGKSDSINASNFYTKLEAELISTNKNVVLVSSNTMEALKLAYPNYYADTRVFLLELNKLMSL